LTLEEFLAWDPVVERLAAQPPNWDPGKERGYHAITFGFLVGEVIRRLTGDTVGDWLAREVAKPLALDLWIGLPPGLEPRVAPLLDFLPTEEISEFYTALLTPGTMTYRAFMNPGLAILTFNDPAMHSAELPAVNGITDARSLARLYAACIGPVDGIRLLDEATVDEARREQSRGPDLVLVDRDEVANGLGFMMPDDVVPMAGAGSFGHPGLGGSIAFANPELDLAFGYVMDQCLDFGPHRDPRSADLAEAVVRCL
jgi:CubicO group peptidase (beta-lactamase class C family)